MEKYSFDSIDLQTKAWGIFEISDGMGTPGFRGENIQIPFQDGKRWMKKRYNDRVLTFLMWLKSVDPTTGIIPVGKTANQVLTENIDTLSRLFGSPVSIHYPNRCWMVSPVKRRSRSCVQSALAVKPRGLPNLPSIYQWQIRSFMARTFFLICRSYLHFLMPGLMPIPVPRQRQKLVWFYSDHWNHPNSNAKKPGSGCSFKAASPKARPSQSIAMISPVKKNALNLISAIKHGGDANWLFLDAGDNHLTLTSGCVGGSCQLLYYPAYF